MSSFLLANGAAVKSENNQIVHDPVIQILRRARDLHQAGDLKQAELYYKQVLSKDSKNVRALSSYGILLKEQERLNESLRILKKAARLNPSDPETQNGMGMIFRAMGKPLDAIKFYEKAIELAPDFIGAKNNLGIVYRELGDFEQAAKCFEAVLDVNPNMSEAWNGLARTRKFNGDMAQLDKLREVISTGVLSQESRRQAAYAMGKLCDDAGLYEEAFQNYKIGNDLSAPATPWQSSQKESIDIIESYNAENIKEMKRASVDGGKPTPQPILILGMPRSSTSLVEQIISSHSGAIGGGELNFFRDKTLLTSKRSGVRFDDYPFGVVNETSKKLEKIRSDFFECFKTLRKDQKKPPLAVTDKTPFNFRYLGLVEQVLPEAKIINCCRNPLDTILSIFFTDFSEAYSFTTDLECIARYYQDYEKLMNHWQATSNLSIYNLDYERLIHDQEDVTRELIDFCELPWDDKCMSYHKTKRQVSTPSDWQVRQPIYKNSLERWKNYEAEMKNVRKILNL